MREFTKKNSTLSSLKWETKMIYSLFLLTCLAGYVIMALLIIYGPKFDAASIANHFRGNEELYMYGKTYGELLELTHSHLFALPLLIMVKGHIFLLTTWRPSLKIVVLGAAFLSVPLIIGTPWLITYGSGNYAWMLNLGRLLFALTALLFTIIPIIEMWFYSNKNKIASLYHHHH